MKRGVPPPDFIVNAPTVDIPALMYIEAFYTLSTCRAYAGMAGVPTDIPWLAIRAYSDMMGLDGEEAVRFAKIISALDVWYLARGHRGAGSGKQADENIGRESSSEG